MVAIYFMDIILWIF